MTHVRVYTRLVDDMGKTRFGFRNSFGTKETLFSMNAKSAGKLIIVIMPALSIFRKPLTW